jgi:hypothetical protein
MEESLLLIPSIIWTTAMESTDFMVFHAASDEA